MENCSELHVNRVSAGASRNPQLELGYLERLLPGKFNFANLEFRIEDERLKTVPP